MDGTIGEIRLFASNFSPKNWVFCQGQLIQIRSNTALFSILGTAYGGNGSTTFQLPDFGGRAPVGVGQSPGTSSYDRGDQGGTPNVALTLDEFPQHTHTATATTSTPGSATATLNAVNAASSTNPAGNFLGTDPGFSFYAPATAALVSMAAGALTLSNVTAPQVNAATLAIAGGSQPHNNMQPYLVLNYLICLTGDFPARN
jgi:microcystin-dependent protein